MCPFFITHVFSFELVRVTIIDQLTIIEDDDLFFGQIVSNDDAIMSTLKNELQLYRWLVV